MPCEAVLKYAFLHNKKAIYYNKQQLKAITPAQAFYLCLDRMPATPAGKIVKNRLTNMKCQVVNRLVNACQSN